MIKKLVVISLILFLFAPHFADAAVSSEFPIIWNLSNTFESTTGTTYPTVLGAAGGIPWDGTKFDGIKAVYLEAALKRTSTCLPNGNPTANLDLFNVDAGTTITSSEITTINSSFVLVRSGDISANMPSGAATLMMRMRSTQSCATASYAQAHLIIVMQMKSGAKWRIIRDIGDDETQNNASYTEFVFPKRLVHTGTNYDGTVSISIGVTHLISDSSFGDTAFVELFDRTASAQVTGSEIFTGSDALVYTQSGALTLTGGNEFTVRRKNTNDAGGVTQTIRNAHLIIDQSATPTKTELDYTLLITDRTSVSTAYQVFGHMLQYDTASFVNNTRSLYHEGVMKNSGASNSSFLNANDDGVAITNAQINSTGTTMTRVRSASTLTEPADGSDVEHAHKVSAGTGTFTVSRILVVVTGLEVVAAAPSARRNYYNAGIIQ